MADHRGGSSGSGVSGIALRAGSRHSPVFVPAPSVLTIRGCELLAPTSMPFLGVEVTGPRLSGAFVNGDVADTVFNRVRVERVRAVGHTTAWLMALTVLGAVFEVVREGFATFAGALGPRSLTVPLPVGSGPTTTRRAGMQALALVCDPARSRFVGEMVRRGGVGMTQLPVVGTSHTMLRSIRRRPPSLKSTGTRLRVLTSPL